MHLAHRDTALRRGLAGAARQDRSLQEAHGLDLPLGVVGSAAISTSTSACRSQPDEPRARVQFRHGRSLVRPRRAPGLSAFRRGDDGAIYHTYSTYARGLDVLNGAYQLLDITSKGRDEAALPWLDGLGEAPRPLLISVTGGDDGSHARVHGVPPSTFTRTVLLACHEKGIDYELVPTMPGEIAAINPFRKIPAITHGDLVLFESDGDPALSRADLSRAEAVAGGLGGHRDVRPMDRAPSAIRWSMRPCATWRPASASCRCRPRCSGSISTRRARSCRSSTVSSARRATSRAMPLTRGRPLPGAGPGLLPRHSRAAGDRRSGAELHAVGARDGGPAERGGDRAAAEAAACRLIRERYWRHPDLRRAAQHRSSAPYSCMAVPSEKAVEYDAGADRARESRRPSIRWARSRCDEARRAHALRTASDRMRYIDLHFL